jgi:hypothetical protein
MNATFFRVVLALISSVVMSSAALAVNPAHWTYIEQILNTDTTKTWTSPTAIDLGKMVWVYDYEIVKVTGTVSIPLFGDFTQDITSSIDPALRTGSGETTNLPAVIVMDELAYADTGTAADILIEVNSMGFGHAEFKDIQLGSIDVPLAGNRPIKRMNLEAKISVVGYDFGDYNRDFSVDAADYVVWRKTTGSAADYESWRANFGLVSSVTPAAGGAVPEPGTAALLASAAGAGLIRRRIRPAHTLAAGV